MDIQSKAYEIIIDYLNKTLNVNVAFNNLNIGTITDEEFDSIYQRNELNDWSCLSKEEIPLIKEAIDTISSRLGLKLKDLELLPV